MFAMEMRQEERSVTRPDICRARRALAGPTRRLRQRVILLRSAHVAPKHEVGSAIPDKPSEPEHVTDGLSMFREMAGRLAPGRTVSTQIRTVSRALYGHLSAGWRRTKGVAYGEAGPPTVLNFKYRYEAWKIKFVARHEAMAERHFKELAERLDRLETRIARDNSKGPGLDRR